jgi:uncharacterized tellurite resistance protein B-like protein
MKVRDRIGTITQLFLGALYADRRCGDAEKKATRRLISDLIVRPDLPAEVEQLIESFDPDQFNLEAVARDFASDPPMNRRRLLELVAQLCLADGELDLDEDDYLHRLARSLGMAPSEYEDLVLDYETQELRKSFEMLRVSSLDLRAPPEG